MGIWRWDIRTGVVEWSESLEALLGMQAGSFGGTYEALQEILHPDDRHPLRERIAEAFRNGPYYTVENRLRKIDGSYLWVRGQGKVVADENNEPVGLMGVVWDISERKQNEADRQFLLDFSAMLSRCSDEDQLADMAVTAVAKYFGALRCVYAEVDHAAHILHNRSQYCTEGAPVPRRRALSEHDGLLAHMAADSFVAIGNAETDPRTAQTYATVHLPAGTRAFLSVPLRREGTWSAAFTIGSKTVRTWQDREIELLRQTAERFWPALENARLLQEAREKQEQFQGTFEQAAVGMSHVGLDGRWLRVNKRICEITGYSREELLASRFQDITHPDDLAADLEQFDALQRGEMPYYSMEKRYFHKSGNIIWIKLTVSIRWGSGPEYAISVIEDITASKKTARELAAIHSLAGMRLREIEAIYSQAPVGLLFLDKDLRFVRINDHLAKQNGIPVADHIGRTLVEVLPQTGAWLEPMLRSVMETRQPMVDVELRNPSAMGAERETIWLVSYFPLEGTDGTVLGLNGVVQNITGRKRAEASLMETAERLKLATSAAQLGVFVWDAREDRAYWENPRMYQILGRNPEDEPVSNREFLQSVVLPEDAAAHAEALNNSMKSGEPFVHACRIRRRDKAVRWVEFSGRFEMDADRKPLRLTGVLADITERMDAERLLLEQKQHLRRVLDSLFVFVGVLNLDGVLLEANRAPLQAAGIEYGEVLGKPFPDTHWWSYSEETKQRIRESILRAQAGELSRFDVRARMKGGALVTLDWMISPLRDETEKITYLIASAVPIEERKRMEEALRRSEERYLLAEWATNDGLWDWNPVTDECYFSPRFKALLGLEPEEMENTGAAVFSRVHPEDLPVLMEAVRRHSEEGLLYDVEVQLVLKNGNYRWFRTRGKAVRNENGEVVRMVGSMTDIHDLKPQKDLRSRAQEPAISI
jgi:PAS domain S-box-containing protein